MRMKQTVQKEEICFHLYFLESLFVDFHSTILNLFEILNSRYSRENLNPDKVRTCRYSVHCDPYMEIVILTDSFRINKNQTQPSRLANFCGRTNWRIYAAKIFQVLNYQSKVLKCCNGSLVLFILFSCKPEVTCQRLAIFLHVECFTQLPRGRTHKKRVPGEVETLLCPSLIQLSPGLSQWLAVAGTAKDLFCLLKLMPLF